MALLYPHCDCERRGSVSIWVETEKLDLITEDAEGIENNPEASLFSPSFLSFVVNFRIALPNALKISTIQKNLKIQAK